MTSVAKMDLDFRWGVHNVRYKSLLYLSDKLQGDKKEGLNKLSFVEYNDPSALRLLAKHSLLQENPGIAASVSPFGYSRGILRKETLVTKLAHSSQKDDGHVVISRRYDRELVRECLVDILSRFYKWSRFSQIGSGWLIHDWTTIHYAPYFRSIEKLSYSARIEIKMRSTHVNKKAIFTYGENVHID